MSGPKRLDHVVTWVLEHPWAVTRPMLQTIAGVIVRRIDGVEAQVEFERREPTGPGKATGIAVIPMYGVLSPRANLFSDVSGMATYEDAIHALDEAVAAPDIATIIFDWDSPGGSVAGANDLAQHILQARKVKRIVSVANHDCCSAAYWCGACAHELIATSSAFVGSIGVYSIHEDLSKAFEQIGLKVTYISQGKYKVDGNEAEALSDSARARMQKGVDYFYGLMTADIALGRGVSVEKVQKGYAEGAAVTPDEALALGMIDRISTLEEVIEHERSQAASRTLVAQTRDFEQQFVALRF